MRNRRLLDSFDLHAEAGLAGGEAAGFHGLKI
jgi:hypothetical protein